jgi:DNA-binding response OmpR family regulator
MKVLVYNQAGEIENTTKIVFEEGLVSYEVSTSPDDVLYRCLKWQYAALIVTGTWSNTVICDLVADMQKAKLTLPVFILLNRQSLTVVPELLLFGLTHFYLVPGDYARLVSDIAKADLGKAAEELVCISGDFSVDVLRHQVTFQGHALPLTKKEFSLLSLLIRQNGKVASRALIWDEVWGGNEFPLANTIDVHMNRLRKKLPLAARALLRTVHGMGYQVSS